MVNNSTNINKTKESLNSEGQQFTNINKTKERLNFLCFIDIVGIVDYH